MRQQGAAIRWDICLRIKHNRVKWNNDGVAQWVTPVRPLFLTRFME